MKLKNLILAGMALSLCAVAIMVSPVQSATYRLGANTPMSFNPTRQVTKSATYTITTSDSLVNITTSSADIVVTLPSISTVRSANASSSFKILKTDSTAKKVVVTPASGDTIGGESTRYIVNQNDFIIISKGPGRDWNVDFESPYTQEDHEAGTLDFNGLNSTELAASTVIVGTTPYLGIGDAGAEDTKMYFDGNAADFHMGLEDATDDLKIGLGQTLGTTERITIAEGTGTLVTLGDGVTAVDTVLAFDGNAQDFYIGLDDTDDDLNFGLGSTAGTTPAFSIDEDLVTTWTGGTVALAATTTGADTLTVAECGKTIFLNNATGYATTLPTVGGTTGPAGCEFTFIVKTALTSGNHTVVTGNTHENVMEGMVTHAAAVSACASEDTLTFVDTVLPGAWVHVVSDGAAWYVTGEAVTTNLLTCTTT